MGTAALQHCMITNLPSPPLSGAPSELAFVSLISQMAKKWYLEVNEIHMNTSAQHSRGFTIYKMIIDSKVLLLPGNLGCPAPLPPLTSAFHSPPFPSHPGPARGPAWDP